MMSDRLGIITDLFTDPSQSTQDQLVQTMKAKLRTSPSDSFVFSRRRKGKPFPGCKVLVSNDGIDLLFRAKNAFDDAQIREIILVTTLIAKKYWETICLHIFSAIHNWTVWGVDVTGQGQDIQVPILEDAEVSVNDYLKTVGNADDVKIVRSKIIPDDMFNAGFHERYGGVSHYAPLASLNMLYTIKKPDPVVVIKENHRRLAKAAGIDLSTLNIANVEHKTRIWVVGTEPPPKYDGLVTNIPGVTIAVPGADCCMILLADTRKGACGAVHSGWLGTTLGSVRACLKTMVDEFGTDPRDICAAIGPSVEASCFSLLPANAAPLIELDPSLTWPVKGNDTLLHVDLIAANVLMLQTEGVLRQNIDTETAVCTACSRQFFSHTRDCIPFGNQLGFISCRKRLQ